MLVCEHRGKGLIKQVGGCKAQNHLAVQGMRVSSEKLSPAGTFPFDHCSDEHDSLAVFQYRDPRMLLELVDRRMEWTYIGVSGALHQAADGASFLSFVTPPELE